MIVDGKAIATDIYKDTAHVVDGLPVPPIMAIIACSPNFETQKYLALKKAKGSALGIDLLIEILPDGSTTADVIAAVERAVRSAQGVVVQLPLPAHIDTAAVLSSLPSSHDVDAFRYQQEDLEILPPVVGAINEITKRHNVVWKDKKVVIFGSGKLVGAPAEVYAKKMGGEVRVVTAESTNTAALVAEADIIILGVGKPNLLLPDMVKEGVVVFDAGASEDGGLLVGDAHLDVATKAALFTPVPGGIGPITVALLFRNLLELQACQ